MGKCKSAIECPFPADCEITGTCIRQDMGEPTRKGVLVPSDKLVELQRERDQLRALWLEWLDGKYDGMDLLRRVNLAVHGPLKKPADGVGLPPSEPKP